MTIAGSQYEIDFTGLSDVSPWSDAEWVNLENSAQINTGGIRATGFVFTTIYRDVELDNDIVTAKVSIVSNAAATFDPIGAALFVASGASENYGYILYCSSTTGILYRRDAATGVGASLGSFTLDGVNGDEYELHYDKTDGTLYVYENDVQVFTVADATYQADTFRAGMYFDPQNNNGRRIGAFGSDGVASSGPTVDSITDPIIGTEPVTIVTSEPVPTVDTIEFTVGTVTQSQSYSTGDNITHTIALPTRNLLPPIGTVTVDLKAGATVIATTTATLQEPAGYSATTGVGVVDGDAVPHTGLLETGDIVVLSDDPNTSITAAFDDISQTIQTEFTAQVWDASEETWGNVTIFPVATADIAGLAKFLRDIGQDIIVNTWTNIGSDIYEE